MANQQDRWGSMERRLNGFQDVLQTFETMVDPVPRLQEEMTAMGVRFGEVQGEVAVMGAKVDGIQGTIARLEELMIQQVRNQRSPPRRDRGGYSPPGEIRNDRTPPRRVPGRPVRADPSPPRRAPARGREGYPRYRSPDRPHPRIEHRGKKLELPLFQGEDPHGWLFRAERYFTINGIEGGERVIAASICMEGRALGWYQWLDTQEPFVDWEDLREAILLRFGRSKEGDPTERLMALVRGERWRISERSSNPLRRH